MITRNLLERIADMVSITSDDATRHSISGVSISSHGGTVTLAATDGHKLIERTFQESCPEGKYFLHRSDLAPIKLVLKESKNFSEIPADIDSTGGLLVGQFTKARIAKIDFEFPNYKAEIPSFREGQTVAICLNAEYLMQIAKVFSEGDKKKQHIVLEFDPAGKMSPVLVHGPENTTAVVMPVRNDRVKAIAEAYLTPKVGETIQTMA